MNKEMKICPVKFFTKKLGGKWKLSIIYNLRNRSLRFGQLAVIIDGISRKVLTDQLNQMEIDGLINRKSYKESPPRVEYSLTKSSLDLIPLFAKIDDWVGLHSINRDP